MIYKCKKCGFKDVMMGIQAHLINYPGCGGDYDFKTSNIKDYATTMTQQQFDKELKASSMKAIKEQLANKEVVKEEATEVNKEGKTVTVNGKFEVESKVK